MAVSAQRFAEAQLDWAALTNFDALIDEAQSPGALNVDERAIRWGTKGKPARPWNVMVNVPRKVLTPDGDYGRRRAEIRSLASDLIRSRILCSCKANLP